MNRASTESRTLPYNTGSWNSVLVDIDSNRRPAIPAVKKILKLHGKVEYMLSQRTIEVLFALHFDRQAWDRHFVHLRLRGNDPNLFMPKTAREKPWPLIQTTNLIHGCLQILFVELAVFGLVDAKVTSNNRAIILEIADRCDIQQAPRV